MRLALNFQRIDPTRGGAETYIVDLCRSLVRAGPPGRPLRRAGRRDRCLPRSAASRSPPRAGRRIKRIWSFARNSEAALAKADYDCTVGFINTWAHDVIIPQGGVHGGSLQANALRFPSGLVRRLYVLGKMLNPKFWTYRAIERRQYAPDRQARVVAVSNMVRRHLQQFHHVPRQRIHVVPNAIDPDRVKVAQPGAVRCAFRNRLGLEPSDLVGLFVGHNFALKGLEAAPPGARAHGEPRREPGRSTCSSAAAAASPPYRRMARSLGHRRRRSISSASTPTSATATGRATSSSCRPTTIPARSSSWRPWPAACPYHDRPATGPAS